MVCGMSAIFIYLGDMFAFVFGFQIERSAVHDYMIT